MVFRRFDYANARRLLVLEAEIVELEERLEKKKLENANLSWREREGEVEELGRLLDRKVEKYCTQPHTHILNLRMLTFELRRQCSI